jgi:hypothetical protein
MKRRRQRAGNRLGGIHLPVETSQPEHRDGNNQIGAELLQFPLPPLEEQMSQSGRKVFVSRPLRFQHGLAECVFVSPQRDDLLKMEGRVVAI